MTGDNPELSRLQHEAVDLLAAAANAALEPPPDASPSDEHDIDAYYSNLPGPDQTCVLSCSCGSEASGDTWAQAGALMDVHLTGVRQ